MRISKLLSKAKALRYLVHSRPLPLEKPVVLQFPVIDICNSHCQMCLIWENKKSNDIKPEQLRQGLRNPLFSEVRAVGLNGGEPTLRKDLPQLAEVLFEELPSLRTLSLITNAYNYQDVIEQITALGEIVKKHCGNFDLMVSLDGYGEVHDRVRGKPGNFERAQHVIDFAQQSPLVHNLRIGCTIIKENVYGLHDLFEYCQDKGLYIKYRVGIPHQRLYTEGVRAPYDLNDDERYHIAEFLGSLSAHYETSASQRFFYRSLVDQLLYGAPRKAGCDWQHRAATISAKGELLYCAVQSKSLGLIHEIDAQQAYFSNAPHLREIIANKCGDCRHDYVGLPPRNEHIRQTVQRALQVSGLGRPVQALLAGPLFPLRKTLSFRRREKRFQGLSRQSVAQQNVIPGRRRVLICGWYGTETLGDKGILAGVMHAVRQALGAVDFTIASLNPYVTWATRRQMQELTGAQVVTPAEGVSLAKTMDLMVFGGGPLMAIPEIAEMKAMFSAAREHGVTTVVAGCGVGPLGLKVYNDAIAELLHLADLRIYRDARSRDYASQLGIDTSQDSVAEDPAFTWLFQVRDQIQVVKDPDRKVLLLGLRDFPWQDYGSHLSEQECLAAKDRYEAAVVAALETLLTRHPQLVVRPLPMCTNHFGSDDRWFYRQLFRNRPGLAGRLDLSLLGPEMAPTAYCKAFKEADVALTMRFHSLVFALGLEVPAVAIDYTLGKGKVEALADRFGVPYRSLAAIDSDFLVTEIEKQLSRPVAQLAAFVPAFSGEMTGALAHLAQSRKE